MKSISLNSKGFLVEKWQYFLIGRGYNVDATGKFDEKTLLSTFVFQKENCLKNDGIVGNQTFQKAMELGFLLIEPVENFHPDDLLPEVPKFRTSTPYLLRHNFGPLPIIELSEGMIIIDDNWISENIVSIQIQNLKTDENPKNLCFHKKIKHKIIDLFQAWDNENLLQHIKTINTTFEIRYIRGHNGIISSHAYGIAMDINEKWNPIGHIPKYKNEIGSVRELVPIANELGFYWGGHMKRSEGAHFEFARLNLLKN